MGEFSDPSLPPDWSSSLTEEHRLLLGFIELLEDEQRTLLTGPTENLIDLAERKTRMVAELTRVAGHRRKLQIQMSPVTLGRDERSRQLWMDIRQMAGRAEQLNQTNGELIQTKLRHNQQALTVLHNAAHSASVYGPDGQQSLTIAGRSLGSV